MLLKVIESSASTNNKGQEKKHKAKVPATETAYKAKYLAIKKVLKGMPVKDAIRLLYNCGEDIQRDTIV